MFRYLIVITVALVICGCQQKEDDHYKAELIFVSDRNSDKLGIFRTDTAGSYIDSLFQDTAATAYGMNWTAGGKEIYFSLYYPGNTEIMRFAVESGELTNISNHPSSDGSVHVSPDGNQMVFSSGRDHKSGEIYLLDFSSGDTTRLTQNESYDASSRFSPDGNMIAFCRQVTKPDSTGEGGNGEIFIYDLETGTEQMITDKPGFDCIPDWAPDNNTLAFHGCDGEGCEIYTIQKDGFGLIQLTNDEYDNRWPRWSPDGKWIAYTSVRNEQTDIYIMKPDGSVIKQITSHPGRDEVAEWRPIGIN